MCRTGIAYYVNVINKETSWSVLSTKPSMYEVGILGTRKCTHDTHLSVEWRESGCVWVSAEKSLFKLVH